MKQIHQKEKNHLAKEHEKEIKRLQDEYNQKVRLLFSPDLNGFRGDVFCVFVLSDDWTFLITKV